MEKNMEGKMEAGLFGGLGFRVGRPKQLPILWSFIPMV